MKYVLHKHLAKRAGLHYDLRLEIDGVLKSWAIRKGIPKKEGEKFLAVQTEDHDLKYYEFEGEIEKGYGAGKVKIADKGTYELIEKSDKKIVFELKGKSYKGKYCLIKFKKPNYWLIFKVKKSSK